MFVVIDMNTGVQRGGTWFSHDDAQTAADECNAEGERDREWTVIHIGEDAS